MATPKSVSDRKRGQESAAATGLRLEFTELPGAAVKPAALKSPLADPRWGLAWSNSAITTETLIRSALLKGGFALLLVAVKAHGLSEVLKQWEAVKSTLKPGAQIEIERKLKNIKEGMTNAQA